MPTFTVITDTADRHRELDIEAAYLVEEGSLILFKDHTHATVLAIPTHTLTSAARLAGDTGDTTGRPTLRPAPRPR